MKKHGKGDGLSNFRQEGVLLYSACADVQYNSTTPECEFLHNSFKNKKLILAKWNSGHNMAKYPFFLAPQEETDPEEATLALKAPRLSGSHGFVRSC